MSGMIPIPVFIKEKEYTAEQLAIRKRNRTKRRIIIALTVVASCIVCWLFGEINFIAILVLGGIAGIILGFWQESEK